MSAHVYRLFDSAGELLYIGCTSEVTTRVSQHLRKGSGGGRLIDGWTSEEYATREQALDAEGAAIRAERPPFNKRGRDTGVPMSEVGDPLGDVVERMAWRLSQTCIRQGRTTLSLARDTGIPLIRLTRLLRTPGRLDVNDLGAIADVLGLKVSDLFTDGGAA